MTQYEELWQFERQLWLGGTESYERILAPDALMVLPDPVGRLNRAATISAIGSAARWWNISFTDRHSASLTKDAALLVYAAQADRGGADSAYAAQCSSIYTRGADGWRLVLHQQTPMDETW